MKRFTARGFCRALIGAAMSACLYEPCFAHLICQEAHGAPPAQPRIVRITLAAGFASTISFPTASVLSSRFGWRAATNAFALANALIAAPLFWCGAAPDRHARGSPQQGLPKQQTPKPEPRKGALAAAIRRPRLWLLASAYALLGSSHSIMIAHWLSMLAELGVPRAVLAISLLGACQVPARALMVLSAHQLSSLVNL